MELFFISALIVIIIALLDSWINETTSYRKIIYKLKKNLPLNNKQEQTVASCVKEVED